MTPESSQHIINVIYIKETVNILLPFLYSLLAHSECNFRLVSNGCTEQEEQKLKRICSTNNRLVFHSCNTETIKPHHEVLNELLELETSTWFSFMDSDILATDFFLGEVSKFGKNVDGIFTGLPLWHEEDEELMPAHYQIMGGRYFKSHNGYNLGLSYAAFYKAKPLKIFIAKSGVDFRRFYWNEIPRTYQEILIRLDLKKQMYDTAKVLNIIWQYQGARMEFVKIDSLIHLGGISGPDNQLSSIKTIVNNIKRITPGFLSTLIKYLLNIPGRISFDERRNIEYLVKKRRLAARILCNELQLKPANIDLKYISFLKESTVQNIMRAIKSMRIVINEYNERWKA